MGQKTNTTLFRLTLKNVEWKSKYLEKSSEESSLMIYKDFEVRNYLNRIFNLHGLNIHNCKINYNNTETSIFISFFERKSETNKLYVQRDITSCNKLLDHLIKNILTVNLNLFLNSSKITIKTQNLNRKLETRIIATPKYNKEYTAILRHLKRFLKVPVLKELIKIIFICNMEKDSAKLLAETISHYFEKQKKRHGLVLFLLKSAFEKTISSSFSQLDGVKICISGRFNGVPRASKKLLKIGTVPVQSFDSSISYYEHVSYTSNGTFGVKVWICEKN